MKWRPDEIKWAKSERTNRGLDGRRRATLRTPEEEATAKHAKYAKEEVGRYCQALVSSANDGVHTAGA